MWSTVFYFSDFSCVCLTISYILASELSETPFLSLLSDVDLMITRAIPHAYTLLSFDLLPRPLMQVGGQPVKVDGLMAVHMHEHRLASLFVEMSRPSFHR